MRVSEIHPTLLGVVFVSFALVQCTVFLPGQCPNDRPIVKDFNVKRYSGLWYEHLRKKDSYEFLGDCNTVTFTPHENKTIGIKEYRVLPDPVREELYETYAVFSHPDQEPLEARWNISYYWNNPFFENHRVMETDYETYSITYICLPAGPEYSTDEFLIYTREPAIPVELERKLVGIVSKHYNLSLLFKPRQTECKTRESNKVDEEAL